MREQAAEGLGELIDVTGEKALKEFVVPITGYSQWKTDFLFLLFYCRLYVIILVFPFLIPWCFNKVQVQVVEDIKLNCYCDLVRC